MNGLTMPIRQFLAARSPRERRMVRLAALVVSLGVLVSVTEWASSEYARLSRQLPQARAQLLTMQNDAAELLRLGRLTAPPDIPLATAMAAARAAAVTRGLKLSFTISGNGLQIEGSGPFAAITDWLASMHVDQRLRPTRMVMEVQGAEVVISATLSPASEP
jgi:general secretion pathway protein M